MFVEVLLGFLLTIFLIYLYLSRNYGFWKKKGIVFIEPKFPLGTLHENIFDNISIGELANKYYTKYKAKGLKYVGGYFISTPFLLVTDLDLAKRILSTDFNHFMAHDFPEFDHDFLTKNLFGLNGQAWKEMRIKLTPTFTSGKVKAMFYLMEKCSKQLQEHIQNVVLKKGVFEVKDLIARYTMDVIATCAFGLDLNSIRDIENEFFKTAKLLVTERRFQTLLLFIFNNFPFLIKLLKVHAFHPKVSEFFKAIVTDTVSYRKQHNVTRNDFIDLLIQLNENKFVDDNGQTINIKENKYQRSTNSLSTNVQKADTNGNKDPLNLEEMTAQAAVFYGAGFETAASVTSFCLYELAKNKDVQERLRREIDNVLANQAEKVTLTYQSLQEMTYMDQVMNETLRMYATLPILTRVCTKTYKVPDSDLVLEKGIRVEIPIFAFHHDPDIYPDPYTFNPERFSSENSKNRHQYAFLPFGEGPRKCIGLRFGKLQVKLALAAILSKYELSPASDTPSKLKIKPFNGPVPLTVPERPFHLNIAPRADLQ